MEVRLAGQDDLQLQRFPVVQIGQQPQFFEQFGAKTLGFIDNQNDPSVLFGLLKQKLREEVIGLNRVQLLSCSTRGKAESRAGDGQCRSARL